MKKKQICSKKVKSKSKAGKKKKVDDTIEEEDNSTPQPSATLSVASKETTIRETVRKMLMSKEATKKVIPRSKEKDKEKEKTSREKKPSAEKAEKAEDAVIAKMLIGARGFCKYLLDMKEASLSTYFDERLAKYTATGETTVEFEKNLAKNRSKDHKMYDSSRVKLDNNAYINASHMKFDGIESEFIITQYPFPDTLKDFWKIITQFKCDRVVAIFEPFVDEAIEEFNKIACSVSPTPTCTPILNSSTSSVSPSGEKSHTKKEIEALSIRCDTNFLKSFFPLHPDHYMNLNGWLINTRKVEMDDKSKNWINTYTVEIVAEECSEATFVKIINCVSWNWKKVPSDEKKLLGLVRAPWKLTDIVPKPNEKPPIVVMCDLGLDRSATFILTAVLIELISAGKVPDCDALFKKMRNQRAHCFTMSIFYTYAIRTVLTYLKIKLRLLTDPNAEEVKTMIEAALAKVPFVPNTKKITS